MKRGVSVAGRFLLWFLCSEVAGTLLLAAGPLMESAGGGSSFRLPFWAGYALESLPAAVALATVGAGFLATRILRHRLSGYLILGTLTAALLGGGVYLSRGFTTPPEPFPSREAAADRNAPALPFFARQTDGDRASGIIYARPAGTEPRLAWADSGAYIRERGVFLVGGTALASASTIAPYSRIPLPGFRELRVWYFELGRSGLLPALAAAAGTAALFCGLWPLSRLFRWPLVGTFAVLAALVLLGPLHALIRSPAAGELAALIGIRVPAVFLIAILTGACGVALVFLDFALCPPLSGARRRHGRPR